MINRYPHTIEIKLNSVLTGADTGLIGTDSAEEKKYCINGRMELSTTDSTTFKARFFTRSSKKLQELKHDGATVEWQDRTFNVVRIRPYQTHTEIWLT